MTAPVRDLDHILPKSASAYERVLGLNVERLLELDTDRIRNLWNPWTCDADDLPYLAWALSVDVWDTRWPLTKKRSVVANALKHHRIKGTQAGIETYLGLVDTKVVQTITPGVKLFSGPSLTREQREAWLSKLPQIRIYRAYSRGTPGSRLFSGGQLQSRFREGRFPQPSEAAKRLRPRVDWVVNDAATDATVLPLDVNTYQIFINTKDQGSIFSNQSPKRKRFFLPSKAAKRILTVTPVSTSPWRTAIGPTLTPISSEPELVAQRHQAGPGVFTGTRPKKHILVPSRARFHLYQRFAVDDGSAPAKRPSIRFSGVGRYGYPGHKAELTLQLRAPIDTRKARIGGQPTAAQRFLMPHNGEPLRRAKAAIVASKRLSDKIVVRTDTSRGITAGLPFYAGDTYLA
jgi:hypothetical protein